MMHMEIVNHDQLFNSIQTQPIIINDFDLTNEDQKEKLNALLYTHYKGDTLDVIPRCDCGVLKGEYNIGMVCSSCNTRCEAATERSIESLLWVRAPDGIHGLMNPTIWNILSHALAVPGANLLEWMCNPNYKPQGRAHDKLNRLVELNIPRGFNAFYENFDSIMNTLFDKRIIKDTKNGVSDLRLFINRYRDSIFSKYLPIPSRVGFITESTAVGTFTDLTMAIIIDAIRTISSINNSAVPMSVRSKETRVTNAMVKIADFYEMFTQKTLSAKYGLLRKHVFGSRAHFTARAVITSRVGPHSYETVKTPWGLTIALLKIHIANKLIARGFSPRQIERLITDHITRHHPLLEEIVRELISESPYLGIPILLHRNPTLVRAAAQRFYIDDFYIDTEINAIAMPPTTLKGPNADHH